MQDQFINNLRHEIEIVSNEVSDILHHEDVFQTRIKPGFLTTNFDQYAMDSITIGHYSNVLAGVRRQLGKDNNEISLMRILNKLEQNNNLITEEWYSTEWLKDSQLLNSTNDSIMREFVVGIPHGEFKNIFGKAGYLDKSIVSGDKQDLINATVSIKTYVDKRIAHTDKSPPAKITEKDYLDALNKMESLTSKYILLLNQVGMSSLKPIIQ